MKNKFEILNNFKGFGNPNGKIWFVGIEEAQDFENDLDNLLEKYSGVYLPFKSNEFQMNLYPLGKKSKESWNTFYQKEFGFRDKKSYLEFVKSSRFPKLFEYWKSHQPALTICFGLENSEDFKQVFSLGNGVPLKDSNILCYPEDNLIITPFFGNQQMGWTKIGQTIEAIKKFGDF